MAVMVRMAVVVGVALAFVPVPVSRAVALALSVPVVLWFGLRGAEYVHFAVFPWPEYLVP